MDGKSFSETDLTTMQDGDLLEYMRDDACLWAEAFCQHAKKKGLDIDKGWMIGWFANAIEHSSDVRRRRGLPETLPVIETNLGG